MAFLHKWSVLTHAVGFPKISRRFIKSQKQHLVSVLAQLLVSGLKPGTSVIRPWFMAWTFETPPSPAQVAAIYKFLCGLFQVTPGRAQAVDVLGIWQGFFQEAMGPAYQVTGSDEARASSRAKSEDDTLKGKISRHQRPEKLNPALKGQFLHNNSSTRVMASSHN